MGKTELHTIQAHTQKWQSSKKNCLGRRVFIIFEGATLHTTKVATNKLTSCITLKALSKPFFLQDFLTP